MIIFLLLFPTLFAQNLKITDARGVLDKEFGSRGETFFCKCSYFRKDINLRSCDFKSEEYFDRQKRVEWLYIVPLETLAKTFPSYNGHKLCQRVDQFPTRSRMRSMGYSPGYFGRQRPFKGIDCVRKVEEQFRRMENDLYNIVPVVGSINALKKDSKMADLEILIPQFGGCPLKIINNLFSPPPSLKGDVARVFFYMDFAYAGKKLLTASEKKLFKRWDRLDPVSPEECQRAYKVLELQGNENLFIAKHCR